MPKLKPELSFDLDSAQIAASQEIFERLERDGGMIIGSVVRGKIKDLDGIRYRAGFRLVDLPTAEKLIEIANGEGEGENADA